MNASWLQELFLTVAGSNPVWQALVGGLVITTLNMTGALAVLVWRRPSQRFLDAALGFAAGVMLTASFTSLILPGIEYGGIGSVLVGIGLGALALDRGDRWIPHEHPERGREGPDTKRLHAVWLFILAITLHNMPEGLAVGVGFGSEDLATALPLMLAIGIQNIPEGLAVAVSALNAGMGSYFYASFVGIRAGLVEIPLTLLGAWAVQVARPLLPYAMGFAAGAMLYVISDEIIPETHGTGHERLATAGTLVGAMVMLYLDVSLA
ncbi:MAG: ZIP family metal transporter [Candidatus Promineifilaceae bacterium]|nr:ZIP family metal transporter [Candidatus Promineifilaceae bacterium]